MLVIVGTLYVTLSIYCSANVILLWIYHLLAKISFFTAEFILPPFPQYKLYEKQESLSIDPHLLALSDLGKYFHSLG